MRLLLIDQGDSGSWLVNRLADQGFILDRAESAPQAIRDKRLDNVAAVIADAGARDRCAETLVRPIRRAGADQPLMVLSPVQGWREMIECLDAGADDYVVKPARSDVIAARLRAIIRRRAGKSSDRIAFGDIVIDLRTTCAWLQGRCLDLTRNEFRLLRLLLLEPERVLTHDEIRGRLYSDTENSSRNALEVLMTRLRRKVGRERIRTVRGVGYRFMPGTAEAEDSRDGLETCRRGARQCGGSCEQTGTPDDGMFSWSFAI